jgi:transposase
MPATLKHIRRQLQRRRAALELFLTVTRSYDHIAKQIKVSTRTVQRYLKTELTRIESCLPSPSGADQCQSRLSHWNLEQEYGVRHSFVLAKLTRRQRLTYDDYFIAGYNAREIAALDRMSRSAITRRIERIRRVFRNAGLPEPAHVSEGRRHARQISLVQLSVVPDGIY